MIPNFSHKKLRTISAVLLLGIVWHAFSIHGFSKSLIYCFEQNGEINIETFCDVEVSESSDTNSSIDSNNIATLHHSNSSHRDVSISEICPMTNKSGFDQDKTVQKISNDLYRSVSILPTSANKQLATFIPPIIEQQELTFLETVVLLN